MKRILYLIFSIFIFALFIPNVNAQRYINNVFRISLEGNKNINYDMEIEVNLNVSVSYILSGITGNIIYDNNKLELVNCESSEFSCTYNNDKLLLESVDGIEGNKNIAKLTFKILENFKSGEDTKITLENVEGNNNTVGNKSDFKIHKLKNDNLLTSLEAEGETLIPEFSPDNTTYRIITYKKNININATSNADFSNIGKKDLSYGNNIFEIKVTAENGEEKKYVINVFREKEVINDNNNNTSNDNNTNNNSNSQNNNNKKNTNNSANNRKSNQKNVNLETKENKMSSNKSFKFLEIEGTDFEFKENVFEYNIKVNSEVKNLKIDYELDDEKSKVIISGNTKFINEKSLITISVIAEDGSQLDYKIYVNKDNDNSFITANDNNNNQKNNEIIEKDNKTNNILFLIIPSIVIIGAVTIVLIVNKRKK